MKEIFWSSECEISMKIPERMQLTIILSHQKSRRHTLSKKTILERKNVSG